MATRPRPPTLYLEPGVQIGKYKLEAAIGRGGFATVYRALQQGPAGFSRPVAVKILHNSDRLGSVELDLFAQEAGIVANLRHRNIVQVYDFVREGDFYFLVIELVDGVTAKDLRRVRSPVLPPWLGVGIGLEICRGLRYAHRWSDPAGTARSIIHRDVKPGNILVDKSGEVKLTDFGLAQMEAVYSETKELDTRKLAAGPLLIKGTPAYMSPEQRAGGPLTVKTDIYSLAKVIHELAGAPGSSSPDADTGRWAPIRSLASARPLLPESLEWLLDRALSPEVSHRPDAEELERGLEDALEQMVPRDRAVGQLASEMARFIANLSPAPAVDSHTATVVEGAGQLLTAPSAVRAAAGDTTQRTGPLRRQASDDVAHLAQETIRLTPEADPLGLFHKVVHTTMTEMGAACARGEADQSRGSYDPLGTSSSRAAGRRGLTTLLIVGGALAAAGVVLASFSLAPSNRRAAPATVVGNASRARPAATPPGTDLPIGSAAGVAPDARAQLVVRGADGGQEPDSTAFAPELASRAPPAKRPISGLGTADRARRPDRAAHPRPRRPLPTGDDRSPAHPAPGASEAIPRAVKTSPADRAAPLGKPPGQLSVNAEPWAHVFIDGQPVGTTPLYLHQLTAGSHRVKLVTRQGQSLTRTVKILPDQHLNLGLLLVK